MLQTKSIELDNTTLKFKMMAKKNPTGNQEKCESLEKAQQGLGKFLLSYASVITAADLATDEEDDIEKAVAELEKMNMQAEMHLKGVRTCLKEAIA